MFLKKFYQGSKDCLTITAEQGSLFAKEVAGDFNPLHDADAKRFCVPGDLLFAMVLEHYGLSQKMDFAFTGMLGHGITLTFPDTEAAQFDIIGSHQKTILNVKREGRKTTDQAVIEAFIKDYVAFSGHNFPYVLVPLMAKQNVMINLSRPLVMYHSMSLEFTTLEFSQPKVIMLEPELIVKGKRGDAYLHFQIESDGAIVGQGFKKIIISGMREYEEEPMQLFVNDYLARKESYLEELAS